MSLRLLFFVPAHTDAVGIHHELTTRLAEGLSPYAEVRLVTSSERGTAVKVTDYNLVHFFGCWSRSACTLARKAYTGHVPYVVTPLGGLQPWEMKQHGRSPLVKQQQRLVRHAIAVHVCGKLEMRTFAKLGWNSRTCMIKNPVLTSQTSFEQTAKSLMQLYRKVFDSCARLLLTDGTRRAIGWLMQMGLDAHAFDSQAHVAEVSEVLRAFTDEEWRRVAIYAADEHIDGLLRKALDGLHVAYPATDVAAIDRYDTRRGYADGPLKADGLLSRNILLRNKLKEISPEYGAVDRKVCQALLNLHYETVRHTAPLLHLGDLYSMFRFTDMDEDAVRDMVRQLGMDDFAATVTEAMSRFLGLTEGFMPFRQGKAKEASRLLDALTKFGTYT